MPYQLEQLSEQRSSASQARYSPRAGEELSVLLPSVLDRAFKGEL